VRSPGLGEESFGAEPGQQVEQLLHVAALVENVRRQHEVPRSTVQQPARIRPRDDCSLELDAVPFGVRADERDRILRPVSGEDVCPAECGGEAGNPEAAAELDDPPATEVE
jgi:hypothetical protein